MNGADMNDDGTSGMSDGDRRRVLDALRVELAREREGSAPASDVGPELDLEKIAAYVDGDLFEAEARALERDLAVDPRLRRLVEQFRSTIADPDPLAGAPAVADSVASGQPASTTDAGGSGRTVAGKGRHAREDARSPAADVDRESRGGGAARGRGRGWRGRRVLGLGLPVGILAVAASLAVATFLWRPGSTPGPRVFDVPADSRVVACRGDVVRVLAREVGTRGGRGDMAPQAASIEVGDLLESASRVTLGPDARLEVFREDGVYELSDDAWRPIAPSFGVTERFLAERPAFPVSKGETRSGAAPARPIRPVCTVLPVRPSFEWTGEVGEGARLVVDRIEGVVFSAEIRGDSLAFPEVEASLDRDVGYRWRIEDARGSVVFRQTFSVASEAEVDQWRSRSETVRASSVSADVEDLLLAWVAKEAGLCEQAKAAATRLAERGSFETLHLLASRLDDTGRTRSDVVDLLSAWDRTTRSTPPR